MISSTSQLKIKPQSRVYDLKKRLDWGEPALTIIDMRSRRDFNSCRIRGAISLPLAELGENNLPNLELSRDIYVYGYTDEETTEGVNFLRQFGYYNVAELAGGLPAWKAAGFPIEGNPTAIF